MADLGGKLRERKPKGGKVRERWGEDLGEV